MRVNKRHRHGLPSEPRVSVMMDWVEAERIYTQLGVLLLEKELKGEAVDPGSDIAVMHDKLTRVMEGAAWA